MFWRTKKQAEASLQLTFAGSAYYDAEKLFENAVYGDKFFTATYAISDSVPKISTYRRAQYTDAEKRWQIFEFTVQETSISGKRQVTSKFVTSNLTLIKAVTNLAKFEKALIESGETLDGPAPAAMGMDHYQAFAEREGIIFDEDGLPHPTLNGEIVTNGKFSPEAMQRARAFRCYPQIKIMPGDILAGMMGNPLPKADMSTRYAEIFKKLNDRAKLQDALDALANIVTVMDICFNRRFWSDENQNILDLRSKNLEEPFKYPSIDGHKLSNRTVAKNLYELMKDTYYDVDSYVVRQHANARDNIERLNLGNEEKSALISSIDYFKIGFNLMAARYLKNNPQVCHDEKTMRSMVEERITKSEILYIQAGGKKDDAWRLKALNLDDTLIKDLPQELSQIIEKLKKALDIADKAILREQKILQNYPALQIRGPGG